MVPPFSTIFFCSSIIEITGYLVVKSNSEELASLYPKTFLANSMVIICIPRQIPKSGILFSLANFAAKILPSIPLSPKPGAISIPSIPLKLSARLDSVSSPL